MAKNRPAKKDNNKEKKGKKEKGVGKRMKKEAMIQAIISVFQSSPKEPFNYKQISKIIGVENQVQKLQVVDILYDLSAEDIITEIDRGRYRLNGLGTLAVGTFARRSMERILSSLKTEVRRYLSLNVIPGMPWMETK